MNFKPELAAKVMSGDKTVTRRLVSDNPRSPWWREKCSLKVGRDYAICPGRGKNAIGRVRIVSVERQMLGYLSKVEAEAEGFDGPLPMLLFEETWTAINGGPYNSGVYVWRVEMEAI